MASGNNEGLGSFSAGGASPRAEAEWETTDGSQEYSEVWIEGGVERRQEQPLKGQEQRRKDERLEDQDQRLKEQQQSAREEIVRTQYRCKEQFRPDEAVAAVEGIGAGGR